MIRTIGIRFGLINIIETDICFSCHDGSITWMILSGLHVETHYVFVPINLNTFHSIDVHDVLHTGSVMKVWWIVICTICKIMVFIVVCHSDLYMHKC